LKNINNLNNINIAYNTNLLKNMLYPDKQDVCILLAGSVDTGKCFLKGTMIMNYDCSLTKVEDIKINDKLMGDDSQVRTVISLHYGKSEMYKITPKYGKPYIVNGPHILCLKNVSSEVIYYNNNTIYPNDVMEISVLDYIQLDNYFKKLLKLYTVGVNFNNSHQIDSHQINLHEVYQFGVNIESHNCIPNIFKFSNNNYRSSLMSGIVDKYYFQYRHTIKITTQSFQLIEDIKYLIRSLGYLISEQILNNNNTYIITYLDNRVGSSFKVEHYGYDQYFGFEIDGNGRFLLEDFSVVHNSSFVGVITHGSLDDGNGSARAKIAKHPHEIKTGKTSDISIKTVNIATNKNITLVDLCGHETYFKTTIAGMTGSSADYAIVTIAANKTIPPMTREHLTVLIGLKIPFIVLITRVDLIFDNDDLYNRTVTGIKRLLGNRARFINSNKEYHLSKEDCKIVELEHRQKLLELADTITSNHTIIPVITISNKTGYYIDTIKYLMQNLKPRNIWKNIPISTGSIFYIDDKFKPDGIGLVVSGILKGQTVKTGDTMMIGPYGKQFVPVRVWSIHDNDRGIIPELVHKQRGCLAIRVLDKKINFDKNSIRRGNVVISNNGPLENVGYQFSADIQIFKHSITISDRFAPVINCGTIRQTAKIIPVNKKMLKTGDNAIVKFRFERYPEFVEVGTVVFFREGLTRGVGRVTEILSLNKDPNPHPALIIRKHTRQQYRIKKN
jgi:GTPase